MGTITLVRHGQANSAATTEEDYDRLSKLGHDQARWLGDWLRTHREPFDHVLSGTMRRHRETAVGIGVTPDEDARLNEIAYYTLTHQFAERTGDHATPDNFADHMPRVFKAWAAAEIAGTETFEAYRDRVREILAEAARPGRRVLVVTSGGIIGMVLHHVLGLDLMRMASVMLPIYNTSLHELQVLPQGTILSGFNATPHLDPPERAHARTYY